MKNLIILALLTIFIFSCKEEGVSVPLQSEEIQEIKYITGGYESSREFDTVIINSNRYIYKRGRGETNYEKENFEKDIDSNEFFKISNSININDFFELDSIIKTAEGEYPGSRDEGVYILKIILNSKSHKVTCGSDSIPPIINNANTLIYELHKKLKKE